MQPPTRSLHARRGGSANGSTVTFFYACIAAVPRLAVLVGLILAWASYSTIYVANFQQEVPIIAIRTELSKVGPLSVWASILKSTSPLEVEGGADEQRKVAIEVGVHTPTQCISAAELGYVLHCFEPSPVSYKRLEDGVANAPPGTKKRIHPHQEAAGPASGMTVPFHSTGGTGDHIGEYDMWKMEGRGPDPPEGSQSAVDRQKRGTIINVPTVRLDDFINEKIIPAADRGGHRGNAAAVHLLKVDTQGFEPSIFSGLARSIHDGAIDYIIFEFWPRGMDLLAGAVDQCSGRTVLEDLSAAGYTLYALGVESHPKAPLTGRALEEESKLRPFIGGTEAYCRWFFELEGKYPSPKGQEEYKFGYWSDFLAVAPGKSLPEMSI